MTPEHLCKRRLNILDEELKRDLELYCSKAIEYDTVLKGEKCRLSLRARAPCVTYGTLMGLILID
jgi:hypothetical protein